MIFFAVADPTPGSVIKSASEAEFKSTIADFETVLCAAMVRFTKPVVANSNVAISEGRRMRKMIRNSIAIMDSFLFQPPRNRSATNYHKSNCKNIWFQMESISKSPFNRR